MRDFWRGAGAASREFASRFTGSTRPLRVRRAPAVRLDQLHHRPRRLHAARPRLLQRQAQRGQPRGQPRRHRRQPLVELRRRGRDRRPRGASRCARASSATSWPRCCLARACRCCSAATRSAARQGGNNNAWCQDNEISWYEWGLRERAGRAATTSRAGCIALRRRPSACSAASKFLAGREQEGSGLPDVWWFRPDGRRMTQRDWEDHGAHVVGVFLNGEEIADRTPEGRADRRRLVPAAVQRPPRGRDASRCRRGASARRGRTSCARPSPSCRAGRRAPRRPRASVRRDRALDAAAAAGTP